MIPSRFTKVKIAIGYILLLAVLIFSLVFVRREVDTLSDSGDKQDLMTDSLLSLLREKDRNTIQMLRVLSEANDSLLSAREIEEIIAEQDSVVTQQRVRQRVTTKRDSLITKPRKKGFFKRLAEAFVPSGQDSAVLVNTSLEYTTDTLLEAYNPADSLHQKIRTASEQKRAQKKTTIRRRNTQFRRLDTQLTARIDSIVKEYEQNEMQRAQNDAEKIQTVRQRSAHILGGIAVGAVFLSAFFLLLIWRDITRSNRYRRQLEEANRRAEELLEAREKLMLAITHDFKAPLGSIIGYTDLLTRLTADERQQFYLDNMRSSSQHLLKLVSDLLDFHRLDLNKAEVNRVTFNPSQLFEEIRVSFEPLTTAKGLMLRYEIEPVLDGRFISDPLRIRQIVNNLLSNAVKFTASGSVSLTVRYASSRLWIDVSDTGKGMAPEDTERIFQEFTRLPGAQGEEGFGLGLSIVHKLVVLLEGNIHVASVPGEGSRFTVVLPLFPVASVPDNAPASGNVTLPSKETNCFLPGEYNASLPGGDSISKKPLRVILIDDDKIQLTLTAAMLEQQAIYATCCEQLDELLEQLREHTFDLLLTDVQMPAINGFDLLHLLRDSNIPQAKTIPVIAVTARSDMDEAGFIEHGFTGCLHKPFTVAELFILLKIENEKLEMESRKSMGTGKKLLKEGGCDRIAEFQFMTALVADDSDACRSIIISFIEETGKNIGSLERALQDEDVEGVASMAHKLLPLFTLIKATGTLSLLSRLEAFRGQNWEDEIRQVVEEVLPLLRNVVGDAKRYLAGL